MGKVVLNKEEWKHINQDPSNKFFDPAKDLFDDLESRNYNIVGNKWFNLPLLEEILEVLE